ncbi:translin-associated factor TraX, putative [Sugiyamaella lignohabitans]|uniref:Translin-associated factor TraX, putative n=1 Tax=Sugiyamaella lignohabitans TaxID=796027 RepID=A0A167CE71_9ASCO|nr:translin-associated factor TraX, putative [Sugiyamaella lignohabitans]ANB11575.1 translin-associated factor TraX, putative [Sugiyamaella lignohabitans]
MDVKEDLTGANQWRYQRNMSGCIQEFIEAVSFQQFILGNDNQQNQVISIDEVRNKLPEFVLVTEEDYILGLMDLTGELMRYAIAHLSDHTSEPSSNTKKQTTDSINESDDEAPATKKHKSTASAASSSSSTTSVTSKLSRRPSPIAQKIVAALRDFDTGLLGVDIYAAEKSTPGLKELGKKVATFKASLAKVEQAICSLAVQRTEPAL